MVAELLTCKHSLSGLRDTAVNSGEIPIILDTASKLFSCGIYFRCPIYISQMFIRIIDDKVLWNFFNCCGSKLLHYTVFMALCKFMLKFVLRVVLGVSVWQGLISLWSKQVSRCVQITELSTAGLYHGSLIIICFSLK